MSNINKPNYVANIINCSNDRKIYDSIIKKCVSCRDDTVIPILNSPSAASSSTNLYLCLNNPIKTYDTNNNISTQTCMSGETYNSQTNKCSIVFPPQ